jgi:hypothetical protein
VDSKLSHRALVKRFKQKVGVQYYIVTPNSTYRMVVVVAEWLNPGSWIHFLLLKLLLTIFNAV